MQQSKTDSLIEALFGTVVGFVVQYFASYFFLHMIGIHISGAANLGFGLFMTVISVGRGYLVRRLAQKYLHKVKEWFKLMWNKEVK